jgi:putative proteasome-type protease
LTYCLAIRVDEGIVFAADTRTNAGVDYVTTYRKLRVFQPAPDRVFALMAAGSLATTRELVDWIGRDLDNPQSGQSLATVSYVFEAAKYVGALSRQIQERHGPALARTGVSGEVTLILGGQVQGRPPEVLLIYPQGNYIAATDETPYLQIGETKYGKPILDRLVRHDLRLEEAAKLALVSLDATVRSNITVGLPFDFAAYRTNSMMMSPQVRIEADTPYYKQLRQEWQLGFTEMFGRMQPFPLGGVQLAPVVSAPGPISVGRDPSSR